MGKSKLQEPSGASRAKNIAKANKSGFLKKKFSLVVYVLVLLLAVGSRYIQLFENMNFETGRYLDYSITKNYPLMVIVPGLIIIALVLLAGNAKDTVLGSVILINPMRLRYDRLKKKIPHAAGYMSLLMALLVLLQIVLDIMDIVHANELVVKTLTADEAEDYNMLTGYSLMMIGQHVLMFFVILTFISIAANIFKGEGLSHANCAALSFFSIWKLVQIFEIILTNSIVARSSELVYTILTYMTACLFFMNTARFFNGMEKKFTRFWMCFAGYTTSILAAVSTLPQYLLLLTTTNYESRESMTIPDISDIGICFMAITMVTVFWTTYVYRVMPKLNLGKRRWSRAPISKEYMNIENIEIKEVTDEAFKNGNVQ